MSEGNEQGEKARALAEVKAWLERRITELAQELEMLRRISSFIDEELAELSFKRVDLMIARRAGAPLTVHQQEQEAERPLVRIIRSRSGANLATLSYSKDEARFLVNPEIELRREDKPFSSFLLKKVLDAMAKSDEEKASVGDLDRDKVMSYDISYDDDKVKEIVVRNYRDESRLRELINSIRWTLETVSAK